MPVKPVPDGYTSVTPYLIVDGAAKAIDFYKTAFGATELMRLAAPDGKIGHAEIRIGNATIMLADEHPEVGARAPARGTGSHAVAFHVYVDDVDRTFPRALAAGAKQLRAVADQFYGDRSGTFEDPFGHVWSVATHKEDLSPEEISRRAAAQQKK